MESATVVPLFGEEVIAMRPRSLRALARMFFKPMPRRLRPLTEKPWPLSAISRRIVLRSNRSVTMRLAALVCRMLLLSASLAIAST